MASRSPSRHSECIRWLLTTKATLNTRPLSTVQEWRAQCDALPGRISDRTIDEAIQNGFISDRLSYAFLGGYQGALARLDPGLNARQMAALCVTEKGSVHPKRARQSMQTTLSKAADGGWQLTGRKDWVTLGSGANTLLVAARLGDVSADAKPVIKIVRVTAPATGMTVHPHPATKFIPEIGHAAVTFENTRIRDADVLPGDGYSGYVKPFRTIEDIHVHAAMLAYLFGASVRYSWPTKLQERILSLISHMRILALEDPHLPEIHLVLGGVFEQSAQLLGEVDSLMKQPATGEEGVRWQRDIAIWGVAGKARVKRVEAAWGKVRSKL